MVRNSLVSSNIILIVAGIILAIYLLVMDKTVWREDDIMDYKHFYNANIYGQITYLSNNNGGTWIRINGEDIKYVFVSKMENKPPNYFFGEIASIGDSIKKKAYGDTIILIKKGQRHYFEFEKKDAIEK